MKTLAALLAVAVSMMALMMVMLAELFALLAELVARLAPFAAVGAVVWLLVRHRARQQQPARQAVIVSALGPEPSATPAAATVAAIPALPPKMPHQERFYLVRGDDAGLQSPRTDGYVRVSAPNLPPPRALPARRVSAAHNNRAKGRRHRARTPRPRP